MEQLEHHKERNAQVLKNQISDLKIQAKGGVEQDNSQQQRLKLQELEVKLAKANQDLMIAGNTGVSGKINMTCCQNGHPLKQKSQHPFNADAICDICAKGSLLHMPFFFRCDLNCNYDICAFCYYLELTDQKQLIQNIRLHSRGAKQPQNPYGNVGPGQVPLIQPQVLNPPVNPTGKYDAKSLKEISNGFKKLFGGGRSKE